MLPLRYAYFWLAGGLLLMAIVLGLTLAPLGQTLAISFLSDKASHFIAFLTMMLWFCGIVRFRLTPLVALGLLAFGVLIELLQSQLPYRSAEFADGVYDLAGILTGWLLAVAGFRHWAVTVESWWPSRPAP